jgi:hypothetical protein
MDHQVRLNPSRLTPGADLNFFCASLRFMVSASATDSPTGAPEGQGTWVE